MDLYKENNSDSETNANIETNILFSTGNPNRDELIDFIRESLGISKLVPMQNFEESTMNSNNYETKINLSPSLNNDLNTNSWRYKVLSCLACSAEHDVSLEKITSDLVWLKVQLLRVK